MFDCGPVWLANYEATKQYEKYIVNQGGTSSSKTYSIMQLLYYIAAYTPGQIISVIGESIPNLKKGAYRDAENILKSTPALEVFISSWNKSDRIIYFTNGSLIEFTSFENEQSAKNGKRDFAFFNEANGVSYAIFWQVAIRTRKKVFLDYNPTARFWVHDKLLGLDNVKLLISDHTHNLWLSPEQHAEIENEADPELHRVYARGLTGKITGLVYRRWNVVPRIPPEATYLATGLDFGFSNDPTAAHDVYMLHGELWIDEIIYETDLDNMEIGAKLAEDLPKGVHRRNVIADTAEPKSIREIKGTGISIRGTDSKDIDLGIKILKRYVMNITRRSLGLKKELETYKWKVDKVTGEPTNKPIDKWNHALDDLRYVGLSMLSVKPKKKGIVIKN